MRMILIIVGLVMVVGGASCSEKGRKQDMTMRKERVDVTGFEKYKAFNVVDMNGICKLADVSDTTFVYVKEHGDTVDIVLPSAPDSLFRAVNHGDYRHLRVVYYAGYLPDYTCKCIPKRPVQFDWYSFRDTTMLLERFLNPRPGISDDCPRLFVYVGSKYCHMQLEITGSGLDEKFDNFGYLHTLAKMILSDETSCSSEKTGTYRYENGRYYDQNNMAVREHFQTIDDFREHDLRDSLPSIISAPEPDDQRMP